MSNEEQCHCDARGIGAPGATCGDCPRDYKQPDPCDMGPLCVGCTPRVGGVCPGAAQPTDDQIIDAAIATASAEPGRDGYILPIAFARAVLALRPRYTDSTPHLNVGESAFEAWWSARFRPGDKQQARDAYAAGMGDPLVQARDSAAPSVAAAFVDRRFAPDAGHVGAFAAAGIGRYEPDTGPFGIDCDEVIA